MNARCYIPVLLMVACSIVPVFCFANDSVAVSDEPAAIALSGSVTLVNDYIWRGQSQTWGNPALQAGIEVSHAGGFYGGFWTSNVSNQWIPGGHVETDFYAGFRSAFPGTWSKAGYDFNLLHAYYPGANFDQAGFTPTLKSTRPSGLEASVALNYHWLTLKTGRMLTSFYGWNTNNSPIGAFAGDPSAGVTGNTRGSWFVEADVNYELAPKWNVIGQVGHQTIRNGKNLDWSYYKVGVARVIESWTAGLAYSASSELDAMNNFVGLTNNGDTYDAMRPRVLLSITRNF